MMPQSLPVCVLLAGLLAACVSAEPPRPVAFVTSDGVTLSAIFAEPARVAAPAPFVILVHDLNADRASLAPLLAPFAEAGFAVLALDLRGHGESFTPELRNRARDRDPLLLAEFHEDLRAAYDWITAQPQIDRARFGLIGAGSGGHVALRYASRDRSLDFVVALEPRDSISGIDTPSDLAKIKGRSLLLLCDANQPAQRESADRLAKITTGVTCENFAVAAGVSPVTDAGVARRVVDFARTAAGAPSREVVFGTINSPIYHTAGSGWIEKIGATNLRAYSSPREAEARGVRRSRSGGPTDAAASQPARRAPTAPDRRSRRGTP